MDNLALLKGECGHYLLIKELYINKFQNYAMTALVKSDWYEAFATFEVSIKRLNYFLKELTQTSESTALDNHSAESTTLLSEYGDLELVITPDGMGHFNIYGSLSKAINEKSRLIYDFDVDYMSLKNFESQLKLLMQQTS